MGWFSTANRDNAQVLVHYMPWFRMEPQADGTIAWEHWQWFGEGEKHDPNDVDDSGHRDIASVYYPLIGPYDGRDPDVLEYHFLTARAAGIEGFVADWYGPNDFSDEVFKAMLATAERYGMRVAICLEEKTFFPPYADITTRAQALDVMEQQLRYVLNTHARSDAYLRHDGKPVFFIFTGFDESPVGPRILSPEELATVLARFNDDELLYVRPLVDERYLNVVDGNYIWVADGQPREAFYEAAGAARQRGDLDYWVGGAYPGFDDRGVWGWGRGPRITERRGTGLYEETWEEVLLHQPDAIQVATWNDFGEGTTIEPTEEYGFTFIDLTEAFVETFTGRKAKPVDNKLPYRLYRLRKAAEELPPDEGDAWNARLDDYAEAFGRGRRFLMNWRLRRLEKALPRIKKGESR